MQHAVRPKFRIGIHTGPLVVGWVGDDAQAEITALGDTVNVASRLEAEAEPGSIVISEATHRLVDGHVASVFGGERKIKGKTKPQPIHILEGLKEAVTRFDVSISRGLTPLVGRRRELELLDRCWEDARAGRLRMVDVIGEAGIGKSRLIHDFWQRIECDKVFFLQGRCTSLGTTTPFLPLIDVVRTSFQMSDSSDRTDVELRLKRGLETLGIDVAETMPYLLNLLGFEVEGDRINALDSEVVRHGRYITFQLAEVAISRSLFVVAR